MASKFETVDDYIASLPDDKATAVSQLRKTIKKNLPKGFKEELSYGMPGYVIPHSKYPSGYHCDPKLPLPFLSMAAQKNFIALYHMGMYADPRLLKWFTAEYAKAGAGKLDMGKSCIRFKDPSKIPYALIGELVSKMTPDEWISIYEKNVKK